MKPPRQRITSTVRARLLDQLDASVGAMLTIAQSPPGFGKTVLFGQWFETLRARTDIIVAWLSLDEDDGEVTQFLANVAGALEVAGLSLGDDITAPAQSFSDVAHRRDRLCDAIGRSAPLTVLILDDYHRVASADVDAMVEQLMRKVPAGFHLVLSTRDPPALRIADLEAQGLVARIGAGDLALSLDDAAAILSGRLDDATLAALHERTEGWAVALQLAMLWLDRDPRRQTEIAAFSGRTDAIARYLLEQVVRDLEPALRDFLTETSILETFDAEVADAVRGRSDSRSALARLRAFDALLISLDPAQRWFRYHQLFAEFLTEELLLRDPERARELHQRASTLFAAQGGIQRAAKHACRAGDLARAVAIIDAAGGWELVLQRGIGFARGLLSLFDDAYVEQQPVLLRVRGYLHMKFGALDDARRCIARAGALTTDAAGRRDNMIVDALLRTYSDNVHDDGWVRELSDHVRALPGEDDLGRGTLHAALAVSALGRGDFRQAADESRAGIAAMIAARSALGESYCRYHLAQSQIYRGQFEEAEAGLRAALVAVEETSGGDRALKAIGNGLLGHLLYWRGDYREARQRLDDALPAIEAHDSWLDVLSVSYAAAIGVYCGTGQHAAAFDLLDRIDRLAGARSLPQLVALARAWRVESLLAIGNRDAAEAVAAGLVEGGGWRADTARGLALAQLHLRADRSVEALKLLRPLRERCEPEGRLLDLARVDTLLAIAFRARGESDAMIDHAGRALCFAAEASAPWVVTRFVVDVEPTMLAALRAGDDRLTPAARALVRQLRCRATDDAAAGGALSTRELAVLAELCIGRSNKEIGRRLDLTENTVKFHLKHIYQKLGAHTRAGAVTIALQRGLVGIDG